MQCVILLIYWMDIMLLPPQTTPLPEEAPDVAQRFIKKDISSTLRNSESGMIDQVMVTTNVEGQRFVKVKARSQRYFQKTPRSQLHRRIPFGCAELHVVGLWLGFRA